MKKLPPSTPFAFSVAGDLTFEEARAALGADAANYTDAQIEELRRTANVFSSVICDA